MPFFRDILLAGLAIAMLILSGEGVLRVAREHFDASLYQQEASRGYALRPGAEGWNVTEGETYVRINSDGMRDRERPRERPRKVCASPWWVLPRWRHVRSRSKKRLRLSWNADLPRAACMPMS